MNFLNISRCNNSDGLGLKNRDKSKITMMHDPILQICFFNSFHALTIILHVLLMSTDCLKITFFLNVFLEYHQSVKKVRFTYFAIRLDVL